ncbi:hypothetical protein H7F15_12660 [Pontibacter sp. Tf4]|uniref:hypothetical protein n=1 Tax=Pontibacter sp. Tf4 TaxID=2761620 RepID=UPI00162951DB|nr:hypothetical protein [Pontibacter sp. Tf4]MBB6611895.1 hypothetical protein [Pontibacter sp. Tf4]
MKTLLAILSLTALFSCSYVSEKETESTTTNQTSEIPLPVTAEEDTLRIPSHQYYLADLSQQEIVRLILKDSLQPADNHVTFALMDSLSSSNKATRDSVFPAFKVVVEKSDGALSEVVGLYAMKYVEAYPKEFAERYSCCPVELSQLTNYIGYEIMMSEEPTSEYKQLFEKINQKYPKYEQEKSIQAFKEKLVAYMQEFEE